MRARRLVRRRRGRRALSRYPPALRAAHARVPARGCARRRARLHGRLVTLGLLCRDAGMDVRLVKWGEDVIPAVREFGPDVILLDLGMPDRGGNDIAEELTESYGENVPTLIAVTGHNSEDDRRMARESGFHDFIAK